MSKIVLAQVYFRQYAPSMDTLDCCDRCDNKISQGWCYCPFCGYPQAHYMSEKLNSARAMLSALKLALKTINMTIHSRPQDKYGSAPTNIGLGAVADSLWQAIVSAERAGIKTEG